MPLVSMRQLLDRAAEHTYSIPAYNVNNLEQVQAVMTAAAEVGAPVILQADGKTIASYDYNVEVTRKVVDKAHATGVTVEGGDRTWQRAHGCRQFIGAAGSGRDAEVFEGIAGRWRRGRRGGLSLRRRQPAPCEPLPGQRGRRHLRAHRIALAGPSNGQGDASRGHRRAGQGL